MYELIVLGLIPGTHMRITFTAWLTAAIAIFSIVILRKAYRSIQLRETVVAVMFAQSVNRTKHIIML